MEWWDEIEVKPSDYVLSFGRLLQWKKHVCSCHTAQQMGPASAFPTAGFFVCLFFLIPVGTLGGRILESRDCVRTSLVSTSIALFYQLLSFPQSEFACGKGMRGPSPAHHHYWSGPFVRTPCLVSASRAVGIQALYSQINPDYLYFAFPLRSLSKYKLLTKCTSDIQGSLSLFFL